VRKRTVFILFLPHVTTAMSKRSEGAGALVYSSNGKHPKQSHLHLGSPWGKLQHTKDSKWTIPLIISGMVVTH